LDIRRVRIAVKADGTEFSSGVVCGGFAALLLLVVLLLLVPVLGL